MFCDMPGSARSVLCPHSVRPLRMWVSDDRPVRSIEWQNGVILNIMDSSTLQADIHTQNRSAVWFSLPCVIRHVDSQVVYQTIALATPVESLTNFTLHLQIVACQAETGASSFPYPALNIPVAMKNNIPGDTLPSAWSSGKSSIAVARSPTRNQGSIAEKRVTTCDTGRTWRMACILCEYLCGLASKA